MSARDSRSKLLDEPAPRAARIVALELLSAAAGACERVGDSEDTAALPEFRVALRRLRFWLRALHPWLRDSVSARRRRQLQRVARAVSSAHDPEECVAWLARQRYLSDAEQGAAGNWLAEELAQERLQYDWLAVARAVARFERMQKPLARELGSYTVTCSVHDQHCVPAMATVMAPLVRDHARELCQRMAVITSIDEDAALQAARIACERLRNLLRPIAPDVREVPALLELLDQTQAALVDIHHARVFAARLALYANKSAVQDATPLIMDVTAGEDLDVSSARPVRPLDDAAALNVVARQLRSVAEEQFALITRHWLDGNAERLPGTVEAIARQLESGSDVPVEIERKFLLDALPDVARSVTPRRIEQGYLPGTELVERVRRVTSSDGSVRYWRTVKFGTGVARLELEEEASESVFRALWPLTKLRRIDKRRHVVPDGARKWEIDDFVGRDLVLAEIELESENEEVTIPDWLAPHVVREVTGEDAYVNANLAR